MRHSPTFIRIRSHPHPTLLHASCAIALLAIPLTFGFFLGMRENALPPRAPVTVTDNDLNFDKAWMDEAFQWTLAITNTSNKRLQVEDVLQSCQCVDVSPRAFTLEPHSTRHITAFLDLSSGLEQADKQLAHPFSARLIPVIPGYTHDGWIIRGTVTAPLAVQPAFFNFHGADAIAPSLAKVTFEANVVPNTSVTDVIAVSNFSGITTSVIADGNDFRLAVTIDTRAFGAGPVDDLIELIGVLDSGDTLPAVYLPIAGQILPQVEVIPKTVDVPAARVGTTVEFTFCLSATSRASTSIETIDIIEPAGCQILEIGHGPSPKSRWITARADVIREGADVRTPLLAIRLDNGNEVHATVNIRIFGLKAVDAQL
jgi:hypothetical protein